MKSLITSSGIAITLASAAVLAIACEKTPPLAPRTAMLSRATASDEPASYQVTGDCSGATIVDPGSVSTVDGVLIRRGTVFDCPLTGDIEGVARVVLNATLHNPGTPDAEGRLFGTTTFLVTSYFGRTDLSGTFEGPFNASLDEIRFGEANTTRHGTGDFQGLVLKGVAVENPPGSGTEIETGQVLGISEPRPSR